MHLTDQLSPHAQETSTAKLGRQLTALAACSILGLSLAACTSDDDTSTAVPQYSENASASGAASTISTAPSTTQSATPLGSGSDLNAAAQENGVPVLQPVVTETYPWDPTSFTQGLEYDAAREQLLVGTGWLGESRIYRTTLQGEQSDSQDLDPEFFGEGVALTSNKVWQLTWQDGVAIARDPETLAEIERTNLEGEGWGLCTLPADATNPERLVLSDGTDTLRILDAETFAELDRVQVRLGTHPVEKLNELECVLQADTDEDLGSEVAIYANVFLNTGIVRIAFDEQDPATLGTVTAVIDGSLIENNAEEDVNNVLNGIAHIPGTSDYLLTGKRWPDLYRVTFQ